MTGSTQSPTGLVGRSWSEHGLGLMCRLMVDGLLLDSQFVLRVDKGTFKMVDDTRYLRRVSGMSFVEEYSSVIRYW